MKATRTCDGTCKPKCRECKLQAGREYRAKNPHRQWIGSYRDRMRKLGLADQIVVDEFTRDDVIMLYGDGCAYCPDGAFEELDHFIPVCHGGPHTLKNVRPACVACNALKSREEGCPGDRRL